MRPAPTISATSPEQASARDVREGGRWTASQAAKNNVLYGLASTALALASPLPTSWLRAIGRALGRLAYAALPKPRRTAHENLARAFPDLRQAERRSMARRAYIELGGYLGDAVALLAGHPLSALPIAEASHRALLTALEEGRGVVFASAHLGARRRVLGGGRNPPDHDGSRRLRRALHAHSRQTSPHARRPRDLPWRFERSRPRHADAPTRRGPGFPHGLAIARPLYPDPAVRRSGRHGGGTRAHRVAHGGSVGRRHGRPRRSRSSNHRDAGRNGRPRRGCRGRSDPHGAHQR